MQRLELSNAHIFTSERKVGDVEVENTRNKTEH